MHYNELTKEEDKIIHVLYAIKINDMFGLGIVQLTVEYGEDKVHTALLKCKALYPFLFD